MQGDKGIEHFLITDGRRGPVDYPTDRWPSINLKLQGGNRYPLDQLDRVAYELRTLSFDKVVCGDSSHIDIYNYLILKGLNIKYVDTDIVEIFGSAKDLPDNYRKKGMFVAGLDDFHIQELAVARKAKIEDFLDTLSNSALIVAGLTTLYSLGYNKSLAVDSDWKAFRLCNEGGGWLVEQYYAPYSVVSSSPVTLLNRYQLNP